MLNHIKEKD